MRDDVADAIIDAVDERSELGVDRDLLESWSRSALLSSPELEKHPCHSCPDLRAHRKAAQTLLSLDARLAELEEIAAQYTDSVGRDFDRTVDVLLYLGLLQRADGGSVSLGPGAPILRHLHVESDLLLYECLAQLEDQCMDSAQFAGWSSMFLEDDRFGSHYSPYPLILDAVREAEYLRGVETRIGVSRTGEPTPGCVTVFTDWARGATLEECLRSSRMQAGDFLTALRRLADLLGQIASAGDGLWFGPVARQARNDIRHGDLL